MKQTDALAPPSLSTASPDALIDEDSSSAGSLRSAGRIAAIRLAVIAVILIAWEYSAGRLIPEFFISRPTDIAAQWWEWLKSGLLVDQTLVTLLETLYGYVIGSAVGILFGLALGLNAWLGRALDPLITAVYSIPKIAVAPLFILWFGIQLEMKVALTAIIVFFFVFHSTYSGVREVNEELMNVGRVLGAGRFLLTRKVVVPSTMPWIFSGMKLAVPQALIGAVVGEIIASNEGLGYLVAYAGGTFDTTGVFAGLFTLMLVSIALNACVDFLFGRLLRWKVVAA